MEKDSVEFLILDIQAMQGRAHALKMPATAKALNEAMNKAGWEYEGKIADAKRPATTGVKE